MNGQLAGLLHNCKLADAFGRAIDGHKWADGGWVDTLLDIRLLADRRLELEVRLSTTPAPRVNRHRP